MFGPGNAMRGLRSLQAAPYALTGEQELMPTLLITMPLLQEEEQDQDQSSGL